MSTQPDIHHRLHTHQQRQAPWRWATLATLGALLAWSAQGCGGPGPAQSADDADEPDQGPEPAQGPCEAIDECETQCGDGAADSCEWLGRMYETGDGAPQDYDKAAEYYDAACDGGRDEACAHLAMMYDIGLAVEEDPTKATKLYEKACASGNRWACKRGEQLSDQ